MADSSSTATSAVVTGTLTMPRYSEIGTWNLNVLSCTDLANNVATLFMADALSKHFPVNLNVIQPSETVDGTVGPAGGTVQDQASRRQPDRAARRLLDKHHCRHRRARATALRACAARVFGWHAFPQHRFESPTHRPHPRAGLDAGASARYRQDAGLVARALPDGAPGERPPQPRSERERRSGHRDGGRTAASPPPSRASRRSRLWSG